MHVTACVLQSHLNHRQAIPPICVCARVPFNGFCVQGFGMADMSPKLAKAFLDMSATYYPERLGMFVLVDTPAVFSVLWNAIEKLVVSAVHNVKPSWHVLWHVLCLLHPGDKENIVLAPPPAIAPDAC